MRSKTTSIKKCIKCNSSDNGFYKRKTSVNNTCKKCAYERQLKWIGNNKEKKNQLARNFYQKHKERMKLEQRSRRKTALSNEKRWRDKNPHKIREKAVRRYADKIQAIPKWIDKELVNDMYAEAVYQQMQVDHMVPLRSNIVCGLHWEGNLQLLTQKENSLKSNIVWENMP